MACPYLAYRATDGDDTFETPRAYCEAIDAFVEPMRADICNDRHALSHDTDCEIYRDQGAPSAPAGPPEES
ncbi:MAG: hypothetical protein ABEJ35_02675 [Halobacteriaceae archaeon]